MTIIEVLVAMVVLLVGVLGTLQLVQTGFVSTNRTTAREQGTNLARDLVERTRQASYANMTLALAPATLRQTLPAAEVSSASGSTFHVNRRGVDYTVTVFACSIDDPTDGAGVGDNTFCATPSGPAPGPGSPTPGPAAAHNVLGVDVGALYLTAGGSLLSTVCAAVGTSSPFLAAVSAIAPVSVCPSPPPGGASSVVYDAQPDDLRRVRIDVTWTRNGGGSLSQTTLLTNPRQT